MPHDPYHPTWDDSGDSWIDVVDDLVFEDEDFEIEVIDDQYIESSEALSYQDWLEECADMLSEINHWEDKVPCFGHNDELFSPRRKMQELATERFCSACSFVVPCLYYAVIADEQYGVWGGTSEAERDVLIMKLRQEIGGDWPHRWDQPLKDEIAVHIKSYVFDKQEAGVGC